MNKKMKTIVAVAVLMLGTVAAMPADLKNEDGKRYEVKVHDGGTTRNTWIDGNSTVLSICSSCEIEVVGVGKMRVSGSEKLIIKNGKLSK